MSATTAYLVTGATGDVGSRVVMHLLARDIRPRVFVRDGQRARARFGDRVEIAQGDLGDAASVREALRGIDRLFLVNVGQDLAVRDELAAAVARAAGVRHLVKLSTMDVPLNVGTGVWHSRGEAAIRESGIGFTFVQPAGFMANALAWAPAIRSGSVIRGATGDGQFACIHSQDIADVATAALTTEAFTGQSLPITGPEALSYPEMVARIGAAVGKQLRFLPISDEEERQRWIERGESPESADYHLDIFRAIREGRRGQITDTVQRMLGRAPISFDRWISENAAAFRDPASD